MMVVMMMTVMMVGITNITRVLLGGGGWLRVFCEEAIGDPVQCT